MIELKLSFNTIEEAAEFLNGKSLKKATTATVAPVTPAIVAAVAPVTPAIVAAVAPVTPATVAAVLTPGQKAAATRKKNAAAKKAAEAELAASVTPVQAPIEQTAASVFNQPVAAPVVTIDKDSILKRGTELVAEMQSLGIADDQLLPQLQQAYGTLGMQFVPMSKLPEEQLPAVLQAMESHVMGLKGATASPSYV